MIMRVILGLILCLGMTGCATLPEKFQPSLQESYGAIKAENGIFIESIDNKHVNFGLYGYKGDIRVSPGERAVAMHYSSPGILASYSSSTLLMTINIKEGIRYRIGPEITRKWGVQQSWQPVILKEEEIETYKNK